MGLFDFLSPQTNLINNSSVAEIYPLNVTIDTFKRSDILNTYKKILTDTIERAHKIPDAVQLVLWDNCVQNNSSIGLVTLLACAMYEMSDLFLVFKEGVLRKATQEEMKKIKADYDARAESSVGTYISFKKYHRSEMLIIYSALEYCVTSALYKSLNLAKAVQLKMNDLRASVSLQDSEVPRGQAKNIAEALAQGKDVIMDKNDEIVTAQIDTAPVEKAIDFLEAKKAFILGLPMAYISGEYTSGIGSTGEADMRGIEQGLKQYFISIVHPVLKAVFGIETEFKSQDFRQVAAASDIMKTFELTSDEYVSKESKQDILARMFDLDADKERAQIEEEQAQQQAEQQNQQAAQSPNGQATDATPAIPGRAIARGAIQ